MQQLRMKQVVGIRPNIATTIAITLMILFASITFQAQRVNGSSQTGSGADSTPQVVMDNYAFSPASLTVKVGTTVTWINHDDDAHTVVSNQGKFKSALMNKNGSFEFRFTAAGEYPYSCGLHPKMTGKIIVQP